MVLTYIPAAAAFSGSVTGALATILTSWIRQRRQHRSMLTSRTISKREELYKSFIEEASGYMPTRWSRTNPRFRSWSTCTPSSGG